MTARELYQAILHHEDTAFVPLDGPIDLVFSPFERYKGSVSKGAVGTDAFGVSWTYTEDRLCVPTPNIHRLGSMTEWKAEKVVPSAEFLDSFDWQAYFDPLTANWDREKRLSKVVLSAGFFERMHHLMGFENALIALLTDPKAVHDFLDALLVYKMAVIRRICEYSSPDILVFNDDYGNANNLFFSKPLWDEFFKPRLKTVIDYTHAHGMLFEMHSCGYITPLIGDMVDMGIDVLQPLQAMNDLSAVKKDFGHRIVLYGGVTAAELTGNNQKTREAIRRAFEILVPGGGYLPMVSECLTNMDEVAEIMAEEMACLGKTIILGYK